MESQNKPAFLSHIDKLEAPSIGRKKPYPLLKGLLTVLFGGSQSWQYFITFSEEDGIV